MTRLRLSGESVLITGAAGGIGTALAEQLVARGAAVGLLDLPGHGLEQLEARLDGAAFAVPLDIRDRDAVIDGAAAVADRLGPPIAAVLGAGVVRPDPLLQQSEAHARLVIDVNVYGTLWTLQAVGPYIARTGGHVLALSSVAGIAPIPLSGVYPATKAAIDNMVAQLRTEWMHTTANAGTVHLSFVDTPMAQEVRDDPRAGRAIRRSPGRLTQATTAHDAARQIILGLERRARVVTVPRWQTPAGWPQTLAQSVAEAIFRRTSLRHEVPGGRDADPAGIELRAVEPAANAPFRSDQELDR
jgi:NAD(P)-dependent dehydrogenase (short-subunit alcohol dehydrogenase family)